MSNNIISFFRLEGLLSKNLIPFDTNLLKKNIDSFTIENSENEKYVKPNFTELEGNIRNGETPRVILISAAGATGKSELTKQLSAQFGAPIFDLSKHQPVGSNSLTGLFFEVLSHTGLGEFVQCLKNGENIIIIDALDEGYVKTTLSAFNSFLDGIIDIAHDAYDTPFILLGRTQVIEHCWLYLDDKGVTTSMLKIEPFTVNQAEDFLDKQIGEQKFDQQYKEVRNYIISSVEGFFKNESSISKQQYTSFIGYAPVLLSIAKLLKQNNNYKALLEDLTKRKDKGVDLIVSIVEYILKRDKEEKIGKVLLPELLNGRSQEFCEEVNSKAFSIKEQCFRLLCFQLSRPANYCLTKEETFNKQYEEKIMEWVKEHPFLEGNHIQNAVFESYIISTLIQIEEYQSVVIEYLKIKYKDAFILFFIFDKLNHTRVVPHSFIQYLYSSVKSLDDKKTSSIVNIDEDEVDGKIACEVEFLLGSDEYERYVFKLEICPDKNLFLGGSLSNTNVFAPVTFSMCSPRFEINSPVFIGCKKIIVSTSEFVLENFSNGSDGIHLECDQLEIDYSAGLQPSIINHLGKKDEFKVYSSERPPYPFGDYFMTNNTSANLTPLLSEKYLKLRKIILLFRSHSKGAMAKFKDKIEHRRVLGNENIGRKVLDALIDNKILTSDQILYYIDDKMIHEKLGVSYLELRQQKINQKTIDFLNEITI